MMSKKVLSQLFVHIMQRGLLGERAGRERKRLGCELLTLALDSMNNDGREHNLTISSQHSQQIIPQKRKQPATGSSHPGQQCEDISSESIRCICGFTYDDGFSIACDDCSRWCHAACFDIVEGEVPEEWRCWECRPMEVDRERAVRLQRARQKQLEELKDLERIKRRSSPGVDRKHHRGSTLPHNQPGLPPFTPMGTTTTTTTTTTGKRKRRPSIVQHPHHHQQQHNEDEHVDIDEPLMQSYIHINDDNIPHKSTRDRLQRQAQQWRGVTALSPVIVPPNYSLPPTTIQPLSSQSASNPALSLHTNHFVRPPTYAFHTVAPVPSEHYITPFTSTITPTSTYLADPLNSYAHLGLPKPFVHLIGPPLDVALDARLTGNRARFVRSGCRPNAVLRPVLCRRAGPNAEGSSNNSSSSSSSSNCSKKDEETLSFGVFALRDLKANEEVVLGWEWDDGNAIHSLPALIETPHMFP